MSATTNISAETNVGLLVIGHGSRREEANEDVREAARRISRRGGFPLVQAAFLELREPNIAEGFAELVRRGARHVIVHPYFLSPGRHTRGDIPVEAAEAAANHPSVTYSVTDPLNAHHLVIEACIERIRETEVGATFTPTETTVCRAARLEDGDTREVTRSSWNANVTALTTSTPPTASATAYQAAHGAVYLVGAGPGDPGLLTIKARDLLASCDVVVYDYLVNPEILQQASRFAERIYVGKVGGGRQTSQEEINRIMVAHARDGKRVVRLKGGDPLLFGRGAEEAEALRDAGVEFEIVPGISSALAVPAYAGIPLTHRELASSVAVITGASAGDDELASALANHASADTLVILMGVKRLPEITTELIKRGRALNTPVAVIRWGTYEAQEVVVGTLETISELAKEMRAPAIIVIGEVVRLRERINWFEVSSINSLVEERAAVVAA